MVLSNAERQAAYKARLKAAAAGDGASFRKLLTAYFAEVPGRLEQWDFGSKSPEEAAEVLYVDMMAKAVGKLRETLDELAADEETPALLALRSLLTRLLD